MTAPSRALVLGNGAVQGFAWLFGALLRTAGLRVGLRTPGSEDLALLGANMMNPGSRTDVLESARDSAAARLRRELASSRGWGRRG